MIRKQFSEILRDFRTGESGATSIEYGMIVALLAIGIIASITTVGNEVSETMDAAASGLDANN